MTIWEDGHTGRKSGGVADEPGMKERAGSLGRHQKAPKGSRPDALGRAWGEKVSSKEQKASGGDPGVKEGTGCDSTTE